MLPILKVTWAWVSIIQFTGGSRWTFNFETEPIYPVLAGSPAFCDKKPKPQAQDWAMFSINADSDSFPFSTNRFSELTKNRVSKWPSVALTNSLTITKGGLCGRKDNIF